MRPPAVLCIGGSDPSSGAGIQGDVRTVSSLGAHCLTAVTAVTVQNTSGYEGTEPVRPRVVRRQIESVLGDFEVGAVKVGMVYSSRIISAVARALSGTDAPIVADPVARSTTGGVLLKKGAIRAYAETLLPMARVATPNMAEAEALSGCRGAGPRAAAEALARMGARAVVVTGVRRGRLVTDYVLDGGRWGSSSSPALDAEVHGSGCAFAASLAVFLAGGDGLQRAVARARRHARRAMLDSVRAGAGLPTASAGDAHRLLAEAVRGFCEAPGSARLIPECSTNFVLARDGARSHGDILAVDGRITRTLGGPSAGQLRYGASKHVASALLEARRAFPALRSAANVACDTALLERMRSAGLSVLSYDRSKEPAAVRERGSSVRWGVREALRGARRPPDAVFHAGGQGKEPMVIVFGSDPGDVLAKLAPGAQANPNMSARGR